MLEKDEIYYIADKEAAEEHGIFEKEMIEELYSHTSRPFFYLKSIKKQKAKKMRIYEWQLMPIQNLYIDFCEHEVQEDNIEFYEKFWAKADEKMIVEATVKYFDNFVKK